MRTLARHAIVGSFALSAALAPQAFIAAADAQVSTTIRLRPAPSPRGPGSTFTNNVCNDPCVCIIDPIPVPVSGRIYLSPAVSIPEASALRGNIHLVDNAASPIDYVGTAAYTVTQFPSAFETLDFSIDAFNLTWQLESGPQAAGTLQFPNIRATLVSQLVDCTTLHAILWGETTCAADFSGGDAPGFPDGAVTIEDLVYYLGLYDRGTLAADLDDGSGLGFVDNALTIEDLIYFLVRFEDGC